MVAEALESNQISEAYEAPSDNRPAASNIKGGLFFRSEPPRPHMKGNENRKRGWCQWVELNHRPTVYEAVALTD